MSVITEANYLETALFTMKSRPPNPDGSIGFVIKPDMPEWDAWRGYFLGKRMDNRESYMRSRGHSGYTVPCLNPGDFDPDIKGVRDEYAWRVRRGEVRSIEIAPQMVNLTPAERQRVVMKVTRKDDPARRRMAARQRWEAAMLRITRGSVQAAFVDILSARSDLCEMATDKELASYGMGWGEIAAEVARIYTATNGPLVRDGGDEFSEALDVREDAA